MQRRPQPRQELLDDEVLIIKDGGELPEVTYHGSLYYLTKDPDGPRMVLSDDELLQLKVAVIEGFRKILQRDLSLENRGKGLYRGLKRCAVNWDRVTSFCTKEKMAFDQIAEIAEEVCTGLKVFFNTEVKDVISLGRPSSVNCTPETLTDLFNKVGLDLAELPNDWELLLQQSKSI